MKDTAALARLQRLRKQAITTAEAALALGVSLSAASHTLSRLGASGLVHRVRHGLWAMDAALDPLLLPEHLTAPLPSYVSFQSALHIHGLVSQIPDVIYVASLARTRRVRTGLGTFSIHRLTPRFFGGFETMESGVRLATMEKALLDTLYLGPARSHLFGALPEVELPEGFDGREALRWLARIAPGPRRMAVTSRLQTLLASRASPARHGRRSRRGESS